MRFAVHGPGNPVASPRSHGVPRRDVPGRVHISVPFRGSEADHVQQLTGRQGRAHSYAPVDPGDLRVAGCWDRTRNRCEGDMPPPGAVTCNPVGLHTGRQIAGPAEPYPTRLRNAHLTDVAGQTAYVPVLPAAAYDAESLVPTSLAPRRPSSWVFRIQERGRCRSEVAQRLLPHCLRACGQPVVRGAGGGELPTLLQISGAALPAWAPVRVLFNGQVPHVPGMRAVVLQRRLLSGRGTQTIPGHANTLATSTDISREVERRHLPIRRAGILMPLSK